MESVRSEVFLLLNSLPRCQITHLTPTPNFLNLIQPNPIELIQPH